MATPMSVTQPSAVTPSVPSPPTRRKAGKVSGPAALVAVVGVIAAAVVGFAIAPSSGSSPHATPLAASASVGPIELSFPSGWRRQSRPRTPSVKLANELAVGPATGGVVAVGFATPTDATLLPSSLKSALPSRPTQQVISLGNAQVYRYPGLVVSGGSGGSGAAYALPTSVGTLVGMCLPTAGAANFLGQCEQVLGSLRLTSGRVLALGPSSSFAGELSGVIKQLNTAVGAGGSRLQSAGKPAAQVSAANDLAGAYARAARAIKGLRAGPATTAVAPLISALGRTGSAYTALGRAVAHNDARGYAAASRSIGTASTELAAAFSQLAKLGYVSG
jgi:hypothetical protein